MSNNRDGKYGLVTTEHGDFHDGEPVVVFRARDALLPRVMDFYAAECGRSGSPEHHLHRIEQTRGEVEQWQFDNPDLIVIPRSDEYYRRIADDVR